ncbi:MAG TPA: preprotein translocase subunit SecE [Candidatus Saccharimonadales bacterium]|nr:preprotein translocase subunit SecE [Candidatus Saccharimonadales bacterium]
MPSEKPTNSKDVSLREIVEKNLAKDQTRIKQSKLKLPKKVKKVRDSKPEKTNSKKLFRLLKIFGIFGFLISPFREIKLVTWPDWKTTLRLTFAVVCFSVIFGVMVSLLDWVFEIIFKKVFLHG